MNVARTDQQTCRTTNWYNNQGLLVTTSNVFGRVQAVAYDLLDRATTLRKFSVHRIKQVAIAPGSRLIGCAGDAASRLLAGAPRAGNCAHVAAHPHPASRFTFHESRFTFYVSLRLC
jgi:YD repeat-containing protein